MLPFTPRITHLAAVKLRNGLVVGVQLCLLLTGIHFDGAWCCLFPPGRMVLPVPARLLTSETHLRTSWCSPDKMGMETRSPERGPRADDVRCALTWRRPIVK